MGGLGNLLFYALLPDRRIRKHNWFCMCLHSWLQIGRCFEQSSHENDLIQSSEHEVTWWCAEAFFGEFVCGQSARVQCALIEILRNLIHFATVVLTPFSAYGGAIVPFRIDIASAHLELFSGHGIVVLVFSFEIAPARVSSQVGLVVRPCPHFSGEHASDGTVSIFNSA